MPETVLVTGATGYVAGWCIVELLKRGYDVRTTVRHEPKSDVVRQAVGRQVSAGERLSFAIADLTSDAGWQESPRLAGAPGRRDRCHLRREPHQTQCGLGVAGAQRPQGRDGQLSVAADFCMESSVRSRRSSWLRSLMYSSTAR